MVASELSEPLRLFADEMYAQLTAGGYEVAFSPISAFFMLFMVQKMMLVDLKIKGSQIWPENEYAFASMRRFMQSPEFKPLYNRFESMAWISPAVDLQTMEKLCTDVWDCLLQRTIFIDSMEKIKREIAMFTKYWLSQAAPYHLDEDSQPHSVLLSGTSINFKITKKSDSVILDLNGTRYDLYQPEASNLWFLVMTRGTDDIANYSSIKPSQIIQEVKKTAQSNTGKDQTPGDFDVRFDLPLSEIFKKDGNLRPEFPFKYRNTHLTNPGEDVTLGDVFQHVHFTLKEGEVAFKTAEVASIGEFSGKKEFFKPGRRLDHPTQMIMMYDENGIPFHIYIRNCDATCWAI